MIIPVGKLMVGDVIREWQLFVLDYTSIYDAALESKFRENFLILDYKKLIWSHESQIYADSSVYVCRNEWSEMYDNDIDINNIIHFKQKITDPIRYVEILLGGYF